MKTIVSIATIWALTATLATAQARFFLDLEGGLVFSGYNRIGIPGNTGTRFDAHTALDQKAQPYFRIRPILALGKRGRHVVTGLFAPLKLKYEGAFQQSIQFNGTTFSPDQPVTLRYKFNSYRLTYRYLLVARERFTFGLGLTAKIRDAYIELDDGTQSSRKSNLGIVPLINFYVQGWITDRFGLVLEGDALVASQGRAEDVFAGIAYRPLENLWLKAGYRILEGGADNEEVYNFNLVNYLGVGAVLNL